MANDSYNIFLTDSFSIVTLYIPVNGDLQGVNTNFASSLNPCITVLFNCLLENYPNETNPIMPVPIDNCLVSYCHRTIQKIF